VNDRSNVIRRTCSAVFTDPDGTLVSALQPSVVTPWGNELRLYNGVTYDDGTQELLLMGVFGIVDVSIDDSGGDLVVTADGSDRSRAIQRDVFGDTYPIPPGTNVGQAIQQIIVSRNVGFTISFNFAPIDAVTGSTPIVFQPGDDPWAAVADPVSGLAASIGCELFPDANGVFTLLPIPDPTTASIAWTYDATEGVETNLAADVSRVVSSDGKANHVIRDGIGTGVDVPFRGEAMDTDPTSSTFVGGDYGDVIDYSASSLYATQEQAQAAAEAQLAINLGSAETATLTAIVKPDGDVDDVISVTRVRAGIASNTLYVIDAITTGFGASGTQQITCRALAPIS
jgi:hypothetical protein